jgi:hypothetical protein
MQHLSDTFPDRWIGRVSTINWPPKSPNLTPLDFCLWSWMKIKVYRRKVDTRNELLDHTVEGTALTNERQVHSDEQHAMPSHELKSALMLTVEFAKMCYTR